MGRNNRKYHKTLREQINEKIDAMYTAGKGRSKRDDALGHSTMGNIYSTGTHDTYKKCLKRFSFWMKECHPEVTTLKKAGRYADEWLQYRTDCIQKNGRHLSAYTINTEEAAINKLFGIDASDPHRFIPPKRERKNITRSRTDAVRDRHFSKTNNSDLIHFCQGTGCRRNVLEKLTTDDLWPRERMERELRSLQKSADCTKAEVARMQDLKEALSLFPDHDYFLHHRRDKGGRSRFAPIIGPHKDRIIYKMQTPYKNGRIWGKVHSAADVHGYRGDYANLIYKMYARDLKDIPYDKVNKGSSKKYQSDVYVCRNDEYGRKLDRAAMLKASKALGHNRISVVAANYLRGL